MQAAAKKEQMEIAKGPWSADWTHATRCAIQCHSYGNSAVVATVHAAGNDGDFTKEMAEAHAQAIAALPQVLRALLYATEAMCRATWDLGKRGDKRSLNEAIDMAKAAYLDATGKAI